MTNLLHYLALAWAWGLLHKAGIITVVSTIAVALVNRKVGGASFQQFLQIVLDLVSPATQEGQKARIVGTSLAFSTPFKVPLLMRSHSPVAGLAAAAPTKKHTVIGTIALVSFGLVVALIFGGCCKTPDSTGCKVQNGLEACAAPAVQQEVQGLTPTVLTILTGGAVDYAAQLTALELQIGVQYVICAVEAVVEILQNKIPPAAMHAQIDPGTLLGLQRGVSYLEGKKVTPPASAKVMLHSYGMDAK